MTPVFALPCGSGSRAREVAGPPTPPPRPPTEPEPPPAPPEPGLPPDEPRPPKPGDPVPRRNLRGLLPQTADGKGR